MEFTVPTSPAPHYCDCDSAQSEERSSDCPDSFDDNMGSVIDFYLAHHTVSNYLRCDELDETSPEHCDDSLTEPYGVRVDYLQCLYDSYLDKNMTLEMKR